VRRGPEDLGSKAARLLAGGSAARRQADASGGLWGRKRHALPYEVAQRLLDTLQTLRADEYFVMLAGLLAAEAHTREPAQQVVELVKRAVAAVPRAFATRSGRSGVSAEEKRMLLLRAQPIQGETALAA
jgi:hypothetical protein